MLLLSALWWMRLSKRLMQASRWEGLVSAHWRVEVGLAPLVGRAMLRKTLSSLSVNGWSCVPTLLVVCPETSQHWILLGFG